MVKKSFATVFFLLFLINCGLQADIDFGSRNSTIKISSGGTLYNNSSNFNVDGTIIQKNGGNIIGNTIYFSDGVLENGDLEVFMSADYDPYGAITLRDGQYIDAQPGTIMKDVSIIGLNNRISGQPLFLNELSLDPSSPSSLILGIQNALGANLNLNTYGTLQLEDNLYLADDVYIVGPGLILSNDRRVAFGGYYSGPWNTDLIWQDATDIVLHGNVSLSAKWTFTGICRINGNGHVLDLSPGGMIYLAKGAVLYLTDIHIRGLGDTDGKGVIAFCNRDSQLRIYNAEFELVREITTTTGSIYVEGPSTFILKDNNWNFVQNATLTVDGITLWCDTLDEQDHWDMGRVCAPLCLYLQPGNLLYDFGMGNLDFINRGTIKYCSDRSENLPSLCEMLTSGDLHEDITFCCSQFINPCKTIHITADCTLNGRGSTLYFADTDEAQFIVDDGVSVTLRNLQFTGLRAFTFQLGPNSRIIIGENVSFETYDDLVFQQGQFVLQNQGSTVSNVFYFRGMGGIKRLEFRPIGTVQQQQLGIPVTPMMILNQNTLGLQNIELTGLEHITNTQVGNFIGAVGLVGGAAVNVEKNTLMSFFVSGLDNRLRLLENNIIFSGFLSHAEWGDNVLHFDFVMRRPLEGSAKNQLRKGITPTIIFQNQFVRLTSTNGIARIIFDDASVNVQNAANAFFVYGNAYLGANRLAISGDPIWDLSGNPDAATSSRFAVEAQKLVTSGVFSAFAEPAQADFDVPIVTVFAAAYPNLRMPNLYRDFDPNEVRSPRPITGLHVAMAKEKGEEVSLQFDPVIYQQPESTIIPSTGSHSTSRPNTSSSSSRPNRPTHERPTREIDFSQFKTRKGMYITRENGQLREIELPADLSGLNLPAFLNEVPRYEGSVDFNMHNIDGNKILANVGLTDFSFSPVAFLNLSVVDKTILLQGAEDTGLVKDLHILNVMGIDNEIQVTHNMTVGGDGVDSGIFFADGSELTFRFINDGTTTPVLTFEAGTVINLAKNATLAFKGDGIVIFEDGVVINMLGDRTVTIVSHQWQTTISDKPTIMVSSDAQLTVADGAVATIAGVGNVRITKKGRIDIDGTGQLVIGNATTDDIATYVVQSGLIELQNGGIVSLPLANHYLHILQGGMITVKDDGRFELNLDNAQVSRGILHTFHIRSNGSLTVDGTGRFAFCANVYQAGKAEETFVDYKAKQGTIRGDGYIEFTDFPGTLATRSFVGEFVPGNANYDRAQGELEEIAKSWVQTQTGLIDTTVFVGADGNTYFRTRKDALVQLAAGQAVISDDASGNVTVSTATGNVTYNEYGVLV